MSQSTRAPALLKGHTASVLCCAVQQSQSILASGSEDGELAIHDLRTYEVAQRINFAESGALEIPSVVFGVEDHQIFASGENCAFQIDERQGAVLQRYAFNSEEINSLALSPNGTYLAAADDSGEVKIINVRTQELHKTLRGSHTNICAAVAFRPHHPWEVLSGGLDAQAVRWNFASGRPLRTWQMGAESVEPDSTQAFNPPLVHSIDVACPPWAPRQLGRLMAVARGDGRVTVYDADHVDRAPNPGKKSKVGKKSRGASRGHDVAVGEALQHEDQGMREGQVCSLTQEDGGHGASVGTVAFHRASNGRHLISGGNDAAILIWDWSRGLSSDSVLATLLLGGSETASSSCTVERINHGRKVNCIATCEGGGMNTFVADTSRTLKAYCIT